jgi:predicted PurR-regulated permease PerM
MPDLYLSLRPWIVFAGCVLVVGVLYWAQAVLVPLGLAILLAFVLASPVSWLQRWVGRVAAVLIVVCLVFVGLLGAGWGITRELAAVANDLPGYRDNIHQKILDLRGAERGGSMERIQRMLDDLRADLDRTETRRAASTRPVVIVSEQVAGWWGVPGWLSPLIGTLGTLALVTTMTIFILLERQELRARLILLFGHGRLAVTTRALDEAATRVSRQLLMQTLVNVSYGVLTGIGLWIIGAPYPLLWGALAGALRFVPYVGPIVGAAAPTALSLAALPGWIRPLEVVGLFVGLELFTNLVLETVLYAGTAGVSQVALLVALAFWTWLWGPFGLLMATPLTICLVALGRHIGGLELLATVMAGEPALAPSHAYYQRLLAGDQSEAWDVLERHLASEPAERVYDAILLPALNYVRRDLQDGRIAPDEASTIIQSTRELLQDVDTVPARDTAASAEIVDLGAIASRPARLRVLALAAADDADVAALEMLKTLAQDLPLAIDIRSERTLSGEAVTMVQGDDVAVVCIADLPPNPSSRTRYLVRKLRAAAPQLSILVGRWAPEELADNQIASLLEAGATSVASTLRDTVTQLHAIANQPIQPIVEPADQVESAKAS